MSLMPARLFVTTLLLIGSIGCSRENLLTLPAPAPSITGRYASLPSYTPLPIPGDSVTITLTSVASDSVNVLIQADSNGRPVSFLRYDRLPVVQHIEGSVQGTNCINYLIWLKSGTDSSALYMTCRDINVLQYTRSFERPYYTGRAARFRKLP